MFDLDYLTDSMNYHPVSVDNQANKNAGPQDANQSAGAKESVIAGNEEEDPDEEHIVLPTWNAYSIPVKGSNDKSPKKLVPKPNEEEISSKEPSTIFLEELKRLQLQAKEQRDAANAFCKATTQASEDVGTSGTNTLCTASTTIRTASTPVNTDGTSADKTGSFHKEDNYLLEDYLIMPEFEDIHASSSEGIFSEASYDKEGVVTDFNNLDTDVEVTRTPTLRIHHNHPKEQILGNPLLAVQTRSKVKSTSGNML